MGYVLDLLIILIFAATVIASAKRGFVKTFIGAVSLIAAIAIAVTFSGQLKEVLLSTNIASSLRDTVTDKLVEICPDGNSFNSEQLIKDRPEAFTDLLDSFGADIDELASKYNEWIGEKVEDIGDAVVSFITDNTVEALAGALAFIALFVGTLIAMKIIELIADAVFRLPVLRTANKILGGMIGAVCAAALIYALTAAITLLMPYLASKGITIIPEDSFIFHYFWGDNNILIHFLLK